MNVKITDKQENQTTEDKASDPFDENKFLTNCLTVAFDEIFRWRKFFPVQYFECCNLQARERSTERLWPVRPRYRAEAHHQLSTVHHGVYSRSTVRKLQARERSIKTQPPDLRSLLYIHFGKSLWFTWIPCNEASACRVSIIKQQQPQQPPT